LSLSYNYIQKKKHTHTHTHENQKDREKWRGAAIIYPTKSLKNPFIPYYSMNFYKNQLEYATIRVFHMIAKDISLTD